MRRNSPQNWVAAATVVVASLLDAGCKHPEAPTKPARPVPQVFPEVPDTPNETAQAVQNVLEESSAPDEALRNAVSEQLFKEYSLLVRQLYVQNSAKITLDSANYDIKKTREAITELVKLSAPEFSPDDLDQLRGLLINEKKHFVIYAQNASEATPYFEDCEVDADYPQLSLSDDKTVVTFTVLFHTTFGPTSTMKIPHDVTVSIPITKQGVVPDSVTITNAYPVREGNFSPKLFEDGCAQIFGTIQFPTEEPELHGEPKTE